jgi:hypothetical protein
MANFEVGNSPSGTLLHTSRLPRTKFSALGNFWAKGPFAVVTVGFAPDEGLIAVSQQPGLKQGWRVSPSGWAQAKIKAGT